MNPTEKQKLFDIRCRAANGQEFHCADFDFCKKMFRLYPKEYAAMDVEVFEATKPFDWSS